jgi:hypothetical protein
LFALPCDAENNYSIGFFETAPLSKRSSASTSLSIFSFSFYGAIFP